MKHDSYVVRIEVFADPSVPPANTDSMPDASGEMQKLLKQMAKMSRDELQDQVHRSFEYRLCGKCQPLYLANPLAKPRRQKPSHN